MYVGRTVAKKVCVCVVVGGEGGVAVSAEGEAAWEGLASEVLTSSAAAAAAAGEALTAETHKQDWPSHLLFLPPSLPPDRCFGNVSSLALMSPKLSQLTKF